MRAINQAGPPILGGIPAPTADLPCRLCTTSRRAGLCSSTCARRGPLPNGTSPARCSIPAGSSFGTWLGWVVDLDLPVVFILPGGGGARRREPGDLGRRHPAGVADRPRIGGRLPRRGHRDLDRGRPAGRIERADRRRRARPGRRSRRQRRPARRRRPPAERVRGGSRAGRLAHRGRGPAGPAGRPAPRPPDRGDVRERLSRQRRDGAPRRGRVHQRQLGVRRRRRRWAAARAPWPGAASACAARAWPGSRRSALACSRLVGRSHAARVPGTSNRPFGGPDSLSS